MARRTDWSISALRALSMCCIVACHLCQCYGLAAAWALNVGVQVFLAISGWLYGLHADVENVGNWYGRRLLRIAVPYWLVLVPLLAADALLTLHVPTLKQTVLSLAMVRSGSVPNGAHLWYVSCILLCYLVTPLLSWAWRRWRLWPVALAAVAFLLVGNHIVPQGMWCSCYAIAFGVGRLVRDGVSDRRAMAVTAICAGGGCIVAVISHEILGTSAYEPLHLLGGLLAFSGGRLVLGGCSFSPLHGLSRALRWSDSYSYEVYLVHQIVILGDFSLARLFPQSPVAVALLALAWTLVAAFVLHLASGFVTKIVDDLSRKDVFGSGI